MTTSRFGFLAGESAALAWPAERTPDPMVSPAVFRNSRLPVVALVMFLLSYAIQSSNDLNPAHREAIITGEDEVHLLPVGALIHFVGR